MNTEEKAWDERRNVLLGELADAVGGEPHVSTDMNNVYVHFFDENEDIGSLPFLKALRCLWNDVYEDPETGEPLGDLHVKDAVRLELQTH